MRSRSIAPKSPQDCQILCLVDFRTRSQPNITCTLALNKCAPGFDRKYTSRYYRSAGWSSPVARWAHNPKVVGSNPTPATNAIIGLRATDVFTAGAKKGIKAAPLRNAINKGCFGSSFSFCFPHFLPQHHLHDFAVGFALRFHHGVAVDVHGGGDLRVPHELLLHAYRCANQVQP